MYDHSTNGNLDSGRPSHQGRRANGHHCKRQGGPQQSAVARWPYQCSCWDSYSQVVCCLWWWRSLGIPSMMGFLFKSKNIWIWLLNSSANLSRISVLVVVHGFKNKVDNLACLCAPSTQASCRGSSVSPQRYEICLKSGEIRDKDLVSCTISLQWTHYHVYSIREPTHFGVFCTSSLVLHDESTYS